jgi:TPR repeat protein
VAASNHIPQAEHLLATMYEYGMGVVQDYPTAMQYYQRAAEQKYIESMYHLSLMYSYGRGCSQDYKRAFSLLELAAGENHAPSCYYLGVFKMYGYSCEPNYEQALNWFEIARGLDDFRISAKAGESAIELKLLMDEAALQNDRILQQFQERSTD